LFDLHQGMVKNEHQYVTKMTLITNMGGLWGHFPTIFWIVEYLQGQYIWNKISKHIMSWCDMDFQSIPLYITYNFQHFELIQYVDGLSKSLPTFQINDSKVTINWDDFSSFSELVMQQPRIQLLHWEYLCIGKLFRWKNSLNWKVASIEKKLS
jgi:hypothetical protein